MTVNFMISCDKTISQTLHLTSFVYNNPAYQNIWSSAPA